MFVTLVPWWVPITFIGGLLTLIFVLAAIRVFLDERKEKRKRRGK